jgi:hypothetical protein
MMKWIYVVPTAMLAANPPAGRWHAVRSIDDPSLSLLVVEGWRDEEALDGFEQIDGVISLPEHEHHLPPPATLRTAFRAYGAKASHATRREMLRAIGRQWSAAWV